MRQQSSTESLEGENESMPRQYKKKEKRAPCLTCFRRHHLPRRPACSRARPRRRGGEVDVGGKGPVLERDWILNGTRCCYGSE